MSLLCYGPGLRGVSSKFRHIGDSRELELVFGIKPKLKVDRSGTWVSCPFGLKGFWV